MRELQSIAFIPDGNRRYARKMGIPYSEAYKIGFERAKDALLGWSQKYAELGVREVTFWALSTENLKRDPSELELLFSYLREYLKKALDSEEFEKYNVKVNFVGRLHLLPRDIQELMDKVMERFRNGDYTINIALAYGGRAELLDAFKALAESGKEFNEENLREFLYVKTYPDLIIRTSGTIRTSGFLPWQAAYSEWYFSEKLWPEFDETEFERAIEDYFSRERRFGR